MIKITEYILEKLKINKDSKNENNIIDMYAVDDLCLHILYTNSLFNRDYFFIEGIKITNILNTDRIEYKYITNFSNYKRRTHIVMNSNAIDFKYKYFGNTHVGRNVYHETIIPHNKIKDIIEDIIKNGFTLDIGKLLNKDKSLIANLQGEEKDGNPKKITEEDLNYLMKKLKV